MTAPLRVGLLCPYSLTMFGGVQAQVLGLARELRRLGVDARVIGPTDGPPPEPGVTSVGPSVKVPSNGSIAPITSSRAAAARTLEALRVLEPDVVHLHEPLTPGPTHAALMGTDVPAVGTFHAAHPGRNAWYAVFRLPLQPMVDRLAVCTAVSAEAQRNVEASFARSCAILPNGVDLPTFARAEPWPSRRASIVFIGRHEPRKGLAVLLDAFAQLDRDAVLWVVGDGPQRESLRRHAGPGVEWLGTVSDDEKARRLRGATIACFPSTEGESFGIVLLEAMAAGTPVVASDLSGYRDVARQGREAVLVAPDDAAALRDSLRAVLDDAGRRDALRAAGELRAAEFSLERLARRFVPLYEQAVAQTRRSGARRSGIRADRR